MIDPNKKINLLIVGGDIDGSIDRDLFESNRKRIIHLGYQPHALMPEILHLSDLVVLPQKDNPISRAQVPAKVFEAMAMAKPIISTAISDLPEILKDCGIVITPGEIGGLAENIHYVLCNPSISGIMGRRARKKCIESYSYEAMARVLLPVFRQFEKGFPS
jgi:glycosyltransferase involved in cell wall biosynthesis